MNTIIIAMFHTFPTLCFPAKCWSSHILQKNHCICCSSASRAEQKSFRFQQDRRTPSGQICQQSGNNRMRALTFFNCNWNVIGFAKCNRSLHCVNTMGPRCPTVVRQATDIIVLLTTLSEYLGQIKNTNPNCLSSRLNSSKVL